MARGDDGWIQTYTGRQYWPLDPHPDDVRIEDIAHHLAMLCRFTGACRRFYSVAEHSVHVAGVVGRHLDGKGVDAETRRAITLRALLHDATEAYCNDIARPVKRKIKGYGQIEARNWSAICARFGMPRNYASADALIKQADNALLLAEQGAIMAPPPRPWVPIEVPAPMLRLARQLVGDAEMVWQQAETVFLRRFYELAG